MDGKYPGRGHHLEQITAMAFVAGATRRTRLLASVMIAPYRHPVVVAKMLSTLDFLSGGRVIAGLGVGWMKEEFQLVGAPPFEDRGRVTDEYIRVFRELWSKENPAFEGTHCKFSDPHLVSPPGMVETPRPFDTAQGRLQAKPKSVMPAKAGIQSGDGGDP